MIFIFDHVVNVKVDEGITAIPVSKKHKITIVKKIMCVLFELKMRYEILLLLTPICDRAPVRFLTHLQ